MDKFKYGFGGFMAGVAVFLIIILCAGVIINLFGGINGFFLDSSDKPGEQEPVEVVLYRHDIVLDCQYINLMTISFTIYNNDPREYSSESIVDEDAADVLEWSDLTLLFEALPLNVIVLATGYYDTSGSGAGDTVDVTGIEKIEMFGDLCLKVHYNYSNIVFDQGYYYITNQSSYMGTHAEFVRDSVTKIPLTSMPEVEWVVEDELAVPAE